MATLDLAVLLLLGGFGIRGFLTGFVREVLSLVAVVAGILGVRIFHAPVTSVVTPWLGTEYAAAMLAFIFVFGVIYISIKLLASTIAAQVRDSSLGMVDRMLGLGFGVVKGTLIAALAYVGFTIIYDALYGTLSPRPDWMRFARSFPLLNASGEAVSSWVAQSSREGGLIGGMSGDEESGNAAPDKEGRAP
jgi:membrane protein required for colicin V production